MPCGTRPPAWGPAERVGVPSHSAAGRHCCMRSGRWSASSTGATTWSAPRRADRRSSSWSRASPGVPTGSVLPWLVGSRPPTCPGGSRLALRCSSGADSSRRSVIWCTGAASVVRARFSASRRRRCARSCVAWAVRTCSAWVGGSITPSMRRRSWHQASSSASTPCWRACSQACRAVRLRLALHSSASADAARAGSSVVNTNCSGSCSQAWASGASPRAWSSTCSTPAPRRRATPARGKARSAPQVRQPIRSRLATWGRSAVSVCKGRLSTPPCGGQGRPAIAMRSLAWATRAVGPVPHTVGAWGGKAGVCPQEGASPSALRTRGGAAPSPSHRAAASAQACSTRACSASRPPHRRSVVDTSSNTASPSASATRGVKRKAHQPAAAWSAPALLSVPIPVPGKAAGSSDQGNGRAIQCMPAPFWSASGSAP